MISNSCFPWLCLISTGCTSLHCLIWLGFPHLMLDLIIIILLSCRNYMILILVTWWILIQLPAYFYLFIYLKSFTYFRCTTNMMFAIYFKSGKETLQSNPSTHPASINNLLPWLLMNNSLNFSVPWMIGMVWIFSFQQKFFHQGHIHLLSFFLIEVLIFHLTLECIMFIY